MKINKSYFKNQNGQVSKLLLVLAAIVLVAAIIVYLVMKMAERPSKPATSVTPPVVLPVYEKQLGDIRFIFISALDKGSLLKASEVKNNKYGSSQKDLAVSNTGAKFIQVTVGAQNKGTMNTANNVWNIENIVDSEGREFIPSEGYSVNPWIPAESSCGELLKPAFDPTPCVKIYEVSKASTGFKIRIESGKENSTTGKAETFLLDIIVK